MNDNEEICYIPEDEEIPVNNPFCNLNQNTYAVKCGISFEKCYKMNKTGKMCEHYCDSLSEEQEALRRIEIERLEKIKEKCGKRIKRIEKLKSFMENKSGIITAIGCFGCLIWIVFMLICLAGGVYAIRWAWNLLIRAWSCAI